MYGVLVAEVNQPFDKNAGSVFEQRSEAELAPKGWSTGMYEIVLPSITIRKSRRKSREIKGSENLKTAHN